MCTNGVDAIGCCLNYITIFGNSRFYDISIASDSNVNKSSFCNIGSSYKHANYPHDSGGKQSIYILAGSFNFKTLEIEVFTQSN